MKKIFTVLLLLFLTTALNDARAQTESTPVLYEANGNYYQLVSGIPSATNSWSEALEFALNANRVACPSHLATITSQGEQDFLIDAFGYTNLFNAWLGGFQDPGVTPADIGWKWVTEEPWDYTNWASGEPNDGSGLASEQYLLSWTEGGWNDGTEFPLSGDSGYVVEYECTTIDIKPGSYPNSINCDNEKGVIAVAILTTDDFDATTVDHTTVEFEGASETHINKKTREPRLHEEDVDGDGDIDLVFHFRQGDTGLECDSIEGVLSGVTFDDESITGFDSVRMIDTPK